MLQLFHGRSFIWISLQVKKMIRDDPRYAKFSSSERKCEKEFKEYLKDKMAAAKSDFRELLKETKTITYKLVIVLF